MKKIIAVNVAIILFIFACLEIGARLLDRREVGKLAVCPESAEGFRNFEGLLDYARQIGFAQGRMTGGGGIDYEPYTVLSLKPNFGFKIKNIDYTTNSMGFRGPEIVMPKPAGTFRVVMLGGSTVQGGMNEKWMITYYLDKELKKTIPNVEVINGGVLGFASQTEMTLLLNRILDIEPDMVIVFDGRNDVYYSTLPDWEKRKALDYRQHKAALDALVNYPTTSSLLSCTAKHLVKKSSFLTRSFRALFRRTTGATYPSKVVVREEGVSAYIENLRLMKAILESRGIAGVMAFQPTMGCGKDHLSPYEKTIVTYLADVEKTDWFEKVGSFWPAVANKYKSIPDSDLVRFYDLSRIFEKENETMYIDSVHYVPLGSKLIAERLSEIIRKDFGDKSGLRQVVYQLSNTSNTKVQTQ